MKTFEAPRKGAIKACLLGQTLVFVLVTVVFLRNCPEFSCPEFLTMISEKITMIQRTGCVNSFLC